MQKLLSLPPNLVSAFYDLEKVNREEWFCTSDPVGVKLGSGGGTTWLLREWYKNKKIKHTDTKRILLHAGGQSRRLPSYAPSGKVLTPIPVFRWERGQKLEQNLLSLQLPLYEKIMEKAPKQLRTLIASGDVYVRAEKPLQDIPDADVVCYGLWVDPVLATHHGVFVSNRNHPELLDFMLQKPSLHELEKLSKTHLFLMDIGIWMLSDRAIELLMKRSQREEGALDESIPYSDLKYYDLYSDFGLSLGNNPRIDDEELNKLSVAILPLPGGEFYHYGTSCELLSSTVALQNKVFDQRQIMHRKVKPNPAIFVQNAEVKIPLTAKNNNLWIENSFVGAEWTVSSRNIITGVPQNNWKLNIPYGICVDVVPIEAGGYAVRPYGFEDVFKGGLKDDSTLWMGTPFLSWLTQRGITIDDLLNNSSNILFRTDDLQAAQLFPVVMDTDDMEKVLRWMISEPDLAEGKNIWLNSRRLSADDVSAMADLRKLYAQRQDFRKENWHLLSDNYEKSVFYQLDLTTVAENFSQLGLEKPDILPSDASLMQRIHNRMLRAQIDNLNGNDYQNDEQEAFDLLRQGLVSGLNKLKSHPLLNVYSDQIVWGRSPVRIDVAG